MRRGDATAYRGLRGPRESAGATAIAGGCSRDVRSDILNMREIA